MTAKEITSIPEKKFKDHYDEKSFWKKITNLPRSLGKNVFEKALILYILLTEKDVPWWLKCTIVSALGYFICPIDAVPDFLPGGYIDDIAVMSATLGVACVHVTPSVKERVQELLPDWCKQTKEYYSKNQTN